MICPNCRNNNPDGMVQCGFCRNPLPVPPQPGYPGYVPPGVPQQQQFGGQQGFPPQQQGPYGPVSAYPVGPQQGQAWQQPQQPWQQAPVQQPAPGYPGGYAPQQPQAPQWPQQAPVQQGPYGPVSNYGPAQPAPQWPPQQAPVQQGPFGPVSNFVPGQPAQQWPQQGYDAQGAAQGGYGAPMPGQAGFVQPIPGQPVPAMGTPIPGFGAQGVMSGSQDLSRDEQPGDMLAAKYQIEERLSDGRTFVVFRAKDVALDRRVAVKRLSRRLQVSPPSVLNMLSRVRDLNSIASNHLVRTLDLGNDARGFYLVTEYFEKKSLGDRPRKMDLSEVVKSLEPIIQALMAGHARGIPHGDLRPSNILVAQDDSWRLADYAIRWAAAECGLVPKDPHDGDAYIAPEQRAGSSGDIKSDQFSMARLVFHLVTSEPAANWAMELVLPEALRPILTRAAKNRPSDRYNSMEEFFSELKAAAAPAAPAAPVAKVAEPVAKPDDGPDESTGSPKITEPTTCAKCGTLNTEGRFCQGCGEPLVEQCPKPTCRAVIKNRAAKVCSRCGSNLVTHREALTLLDEAKSLFQSQQVPMANEKMQLARSRSPFLGEEIGKLRTDIESWVRQHVEEWKQEADALWQQGRHGEAKAKLEEILALDPAQQATLRPRLAEWTQRMESQGRMVSLLAEFEQAMAQKSYAKAKTAAEAVARIDPEQGKSLLAKATLQEERTEVESRVAEFEALMAKKQGAPPPAAGLPVPQLKAHLARVDELLPKSEADPALRARVEGVQRGLREVVINRLMMEGSQFASRGQFAEAENSLNTIDQIQANHPNARDSRATLYLAWARRLKDQNQLDQALEKAKASVAIKPGGAAAALVAELDRPKATVVAPPQPEMSATQVGSRVIPPAPVAAARASLKFDRSYLVYGTNNFKIGRDNVRSDLAVRVFPPNPENEQRTRKISRDHVALSLASDGLTAVDNSSGGSIVDGQMIPKGHPYPMDLGKPSILSLAGALDFAMIPFSGPPDDESVLPKTYASMASADPVWVVASQLGIRGLLMRRNDGIADQECYLIVFRWVSLGGPGSGADIEIPADFISPEPSAVRRLVRVKDRFWLEGAQDVQNAQPGDGQILTPERELTFGLKPFRSAMPQQLGF